jgi:hypothetical protein
VDLPDRHASIHPVVEYADANFLGVHLWTFDAGTKLYANLVDTTGASHMVMSAPVFMTNTWYHVGLTYNGSAAVLYVNGSEVAWANVGAFTLRTDLPVNIGRRPVAGSLQGTVFAGNLDEVAVYSTALTATKIRSHYTTGRCYQDAVLADSPVGYWRLGETSGTTAADGMGGRHGTYDYVRVLDSASLDITGPITLEAWIRVTAWDHYWQAIVTKGDSAYRLHRYWNTDGLGFGTSGLSSGDSGGATSVNKAAGTTSRPSGTDRRDRCMSTASSI